jgi:TolA-binding protein
MNSRSLTNGLFAACLVALMLLFSRQILSPDAGAKIFNRALQFENTGQTELAIKHYRLLSDNQPDSLFAPRALLKQGDLLAALGRGKGEATLLRAAISSYEKLATNYPNDPLANEALLDAGQVSAENLKDNEAARRFYGLILKNNRESSDSSAKATLKLGEIALAEGEKALAQELLQRVLQKWPKNAEVASEAQFQLGVTYETLFKNRDWATRAYDAVIQNFPQSKWANDARQRLGLMVFSDSRNHRPVRRVMIDTLPITSGGFDGQNSLWKVLRPLLAARGIDVDELILKGWSLEPFIAAVDKNNPSKIPEADFDPFENVVANAGLKFTVKGGGKSTDAMVDLQDDLDAAQTPLVFYKGNSGSGRWALCVGYDSQRGELYLQESGARYETVSAKAFSKSWEIQGPFGKQFTTLSFWTAAERARPVPKTALTPAPQPTPLPNQTPMPYLDGTPSFVWKLPALNRANAHQRSISRAVQLLERSSGENVASNISGLTYLAKEIRLVSRRNREARTVENGTNSGGETTVTSTPTPEETPLSTVPETREDGLGSETYTPTPEAPLEGTDVAPVPSIEPIETTTEASSAKRVARARLLLGFFGQPAKRWAEKRRLGAQYLYVAARQTGKDSLKKAAQAFDESALAIETATEVAPEIGDQIRQSDREALREVARLLEVARDKEREAARLMQ